MLLKASFCLEGIKTEFLNHFKNNSNADFEKKKNEFDGLVNWLSWFHTDKEIEIPQKPNSVLAVINNLISRGEFTKPTLFVEQKFAEAFKKTEFKSDKTYGSIFYSLLDNSNEFFESLWTSLHVIDTTPDYDNSEKIHLGDANSGFERWFLTDFLTGKNAFLRQILQQQRELTTICLPEDRRGFSRQRVDFSFECPYFFSDTIPIFFWKKNFKLLRRFGVVIELDGPTHHVLAPQKINDKNRDKALKLAKWKPFRINAQTQAEDSTKALEKLLETSFFKRTMGNFNFTDEQRKIYNQIALSPIAIARIQKTLVRQLISLGESIFEKDSFKVAVVERDVPCGYVAVEDLNEMVSKLCELKGGQLIPKIEATVFNDSVYSDSFLQLKEVLPTENLNLDEQNYDLILDVSILRREGIFKDDSKFASEKTIVIRTTHYVDEKNESILCANPINYKAIVKAKNDGNYEEFENGKHLLTYFLQNLFRKIEFRIGQLPILNRALQLKSVIGLLPTGGGKSITYQLSALLQPGITLVVDPIRSLMINQHQNLLKAGIENCNFINSTLNTLERELNIGKLVNGEMQFCFVSPERLVIEEFRESLKHCKQSGKYFSYCVVDEVHCVSEWGHDFRTPYLSLGKNSRKFCPTFRNDLLKNKKCREGFNLPLLGLTATASFDVLADIERELEILSTESDETIVNFENTLREEIQYVVLPVDLTLDNSPIVQNGINFKFDVGKQKRNEIHKILRSGFLEKFNFFSSREVQEELLKISFEEYLDEKQKDLYGTNLAAYIEKKIVDILENNNITVENLWTENSNGFIIFVPHRTSYFGVTDKFKMMKGIDDKLPPIPVANRNGVFDAISAFYSAGIFMGSGDSEDQISSTSEQIQNESFESLQKFIDNEIAIMVATKAFGMGIDKPNIRATMHLNIPSSLESFVQESGRVGRDGKLAISFILYNEQRIKFFTNKSFRNLFSGNTKRGFERKQVQIPNYKTCVALRKIVNGNDDSAVKNYRFLKSVFEAKLDAIQSPKLDEKIPSNNDITNREKLKLAAQEQWVDFDNLEFFHYKSFPGIEKELVILDELLHEITFPNRLKLDEIAEQFSEETQMELKCKFGRDNNFENFIWINDSNRMTYGYLRTDTFQVHWKAGGGFSKDKALKVLNQFKDFILGHINFANCTTNFQKHNLLRATVNRPNQEGLIHLIENGKTEVEIELKNCFHSNSPKWVEQMVQTLKANFTKLRELKRLQIEKMFLCDASGKLNGSLEDLWDKIERFYQTQLNSNFDVNKLHTTEKEKEVSKAFHCSRKEPETMKAIYRLMIIGVVDNYTIDYKNKTVKLIFPEKNHVSAYKKKLKDFIKRYYSEIQAAKWLEKLEINDEESLEETLTKCLKVLVEFVYLETEEKRFQGIKEMIDAVRQGLARENENPNEGNKRFREEIYYYFNAKYARRYELPNGEKANLVEDTSRGTLSDFETCKKYFRILSEDRGAYLSNLKHLRGSVQKILRAVNQKNACLKILKGFSLYQLSQNQTYFIDEALELFASGFTEMFHESNWDLTELKSAIELVENECKRHFDNHRFKKNWLVCREMIFLKHHNFWLSNFLNKINEVENA